MERRKFQRGRGDIDYLFAVQVEDIISETKNISVGGLMCKVNRYFKPRAVLHVSFILPKYTGERVSFEKIQCKARVARCEACPEIDDPDCHSVGLEFLDVSDEQRAKIAKFVKRVTSSEKKGKRTHAVSLKISAKKQ